jgi:Uma2 family endonuclease
MTVTIAKSMTLEAFLKLPETQPASEYIDGEIIQKPMPKGRHSRLQGKLGAAINSVVEDSQIAYAFPELRCNFGGRSIVPDVAVFRWDRIPLTASGEVPDYFNLPPDWTIEILSPDQKVNRVIDNILHCLNHGCRLGWFLDPDDRSVLVFPKDRSPELVRGSDRLRVLAEIPLELTAENIFSWLKMGG